MQNNFFLFGQLAALEKLGVSLSKGVSTLRKNINPLDTAARTSYEPAVAAVQSAAPLQQVQKTVVEGLKKKTPVVPQAPQAAQILSDAAVASPERVSTLSKGAPRTLAGYL